MDTYYFGGFFYTETTPKRRARGSWGGPDGFGVTYIIMDYTNTAALSINNNTHSYNMYSNIIQTHICIYINNKYHIR